MHSDSITTAPPNAPACLGLCSVCRQPIFDNQRVTMKNGHLFCMSCPPPARPAYQVDRIGVHGVGWASLMVVFFSLIALFAVCFR